MSAEGFEKLRELMHQVAPDKDLRKLAGDLFAQAGEREQAMN
jgi:hypothetical protein